MELKGAAGIFGDINDNIRGVGRKFQTRNGTLHRLQRVLNHFEKSPVVVFCARSTFLDEFPNRVPVMVIDGLYESAGLRLARQKKEPASLTVSNDHQEEIITKTAKNDSGYAARRRDSGPVGYFDGINPQRITLPKNGKPKNRKRVAWGWAYNPENPSKSVWVHIHRHDRFVNGRSKHIGSVYANVSRPDVNRAKRIKGKHGWRFKLPERHDNDGYKDSYGFLYGRDLGVQYEAYAHFGKGRKKLLKNMRFTLCMGCSRLKD